MANLLGKNVWGRRSQKCKRIGCCAVPRRTKSAQRHEEEHQWRTSDQEMPYYWHPTADIHEDYELDPDTP